MTPATGEIWLADSDDEVRRRVLIVSDDRLHRLAGRAIVAPVVTESDEPSPPWIVALDAGEAVAVHLLASIAVERLLERVDVVPYGTLRRVRRVVAFMTT